MKEIMLQDWRDLIANIPSWIDQKNVPVKYAKHGVGLIIEVPEVKPALELPNLPARIGGGSLLSVFTKRSVALFLTWHCGSCRNYAVMLNGTWQHVVNPFVIHEHKRVYVTWDQLEAANILYGIEYRYAQEYIRFLAKNQTAEEEGEPVEEQTQESQDQAAAVFGL